MAVKQAAGETGLTGPHFRAMLIGKPWETSKLCEFSFYIVWYWLILLGSTPSAPQTMRNAATWISQFSCLCWGQRVKQVKQVQQTWSVKSKSDAPVRKSSMPMGLSENVVYPIVPNGFADHYPYEKWLAIIGGISHFQTSPYSSVFETRLAIGTLPSVVWNSWSPHLEMATVRLSMGQYFPRPKKNIADSVV